jgi:Putative DNA-binding domain
MSAPRTRETSFEEALEHIAAEATVWVRAAAAVDYTGGWHVRLVEITSGAPAPSWQSRDWTYPAAIFSGFVANGQPVAEWLEAGGIELIDHQFRLPGLNRQRLTWDHYQSAPFSSSYERLEWPVTETTLSMYSSQGQEPQGNLIAEDDSPSFLSFYVAAASFFWLDRQPTGGTVTQGIMYRHQDLRGRINGVRITTGAVEVEVEGSELDGMMVELPGDAPGPRQSISLPAGHQGSHKVEFELERGLPPGTWALLCRGIEWVDQRNLSVTRARGNEAGVEFVLDAATRLEALVGGRERQNVEFKRQVPGDEDNKRQIMKAVCAFANGNGGSLLIGVDDDRELVGVDERAVSKIADQPTNMVSAWVEPKPPIDFATLPIPDSEKVVLEMVVGAGATLHGCGRPAETRVPYVRYHGTCERATTYEMAQIVQGRTAGAGNSFLANLGR